MRHSTKKIETYWILKVNDTTFLELDYGMCDTVDGISQVHTAMEATPIKDSEKQRFSHLLKDYNAKWVKVKETTEVTFEMEE
jgi:hypothetical protein